MNTNDEFALKALSKDTSEKQPNKQKEKQPRKPFNRSSGKPDRGSSRRRSDRPMSPMIRQEKKIVPNIEGDNDVRVITLGGVEEVGRNMFAVETKNDIYIFDVGFEFTSDDEAPGIDYSLPNITYLEERRDKIKAVIITHAHLDHIGGIPFLIERLGNPTIYTRNLTALMIQKRMDEFPDVAKLDIAVVDPFSTHQIGETEFFFFPVSHSIPECMGISVRTKHGNIIITGDIKLEHENNVPIPEEVEQWSKVSTENNILLISDSTNCENPGWSLPEPVIHKTVAEIITHAPNRVVIACFASHFRRMIEFVRTAENLGKKVVLEGRSMKVNMEIARLAGYFTPKDGTVISSAEIKDYPANRIIVLCTGGQGEFFAALPRMARDDHKDIRLSEKDTIVLSSSVIPGNELQVRKLLDILWRKDCKIITYKTSDVHSTGHGNQEELKWIVKKVNPKYFVPAYGYHSMLKQHRQLAVQAGVPIENTLIPDDGSIIEIKSSDDVSLLPVKTAGDPLLVDGFTVSSMNQTIIADRQALSKDGIFVLVVSINVGKKVMQKSPDIISRGFVYLRESQALLSQARGMIRRITENEIKHAQGGKIDVDRLKRELSKQVERFLVQETNKTPVVIPVILVV